MANRLSVEDHNSLVNAVQNWCNPSHSDILTQLIQSEEEAYRQLTEKDATIAYWEQRAKKWERAYENADRQYLNKEKEAAELRRMIEGREERLGIAIEEYNKLRKALEEAKAEYSKEGTDIQVLRRIIKIIDAALGEGDKE